SKPLAPVGLVDDHVAQPREGCAVGDDPGEAQLPAAGDLVEPEAEGIPDGFLDQRPGAALRPVRAGQRDADKVHVQAGGVGAYDIAISVGCHRPRPWVAPSGGATPRDARRPVT